MQSHDGTHQQGDYVTNGTAAIAWLFGGKMLCEPYLKVCTHQNQLHMDCKSGNRQKALRKSYFWLSYWKYFKVAAEIMKKDQQTDKNWNAVCKWGWPEGQELGMGQPIQGVGWEQKQDKLHRTEKGEKQVATCPLLPQGPVQHRQSRATAKDSDRPPSGAFPFISAAHQYSDIRALVSDNVWEDTCFLNI